MGGELPPASLPKRKRERRKEEKERETEKEREVHGVGIKGSVYIFVLPCK